MDTTDRNTLRKQLRSLRRGLDQNAQSQAAKGLLQQFLSANQLKECQRIAIYIANDGEIDPVEVQNWIWQQGKECYLPIVIQEQKNSLVFAPVYPDSQFTVNKFGILEPDYDSKQIIQASELDLVLLPLVGFDASGNRIGMGGGFYDTTFEFVKAQQISKPLMMGIAHELQRVKEISAESWDIPLSTVITDRQVYQF